MLMKNSKETGAIEIGNEKQSYPRIISCRIHGTWYLIPGTTQNTRKP